MIIIVKARRMHNLRSYHLHEGVVPERRAREGWRGAQEAGVGHLLDGLSDREHERGVHEAHDDVGVELVCNTKRERHISGDLRTRDKGVGASEGEEEKILTLQSTLLPSPQGLWRDAGAWKGSRD